MDLLNIPNIFDIIKELNTDGLIEEQHADLMSKDDFKLKNDPKNKVQLSDTDNYNNQMSNKNQKKINVEKEEF